MFGDMHDGACKTQFSLKKKNIIWKITTLPSSPFLRSYNVHIRCFLLVFGASKFNATWNVIVMFFQFITPKVRQLDVNVSIRFLFNMFILLRWHIHICN